MSSFFGTKVGMFELERGQYCKAHVANPPWAEHQGHTGAGSRREFGKAARTRPPGDGGTCEEGDSMVTGIEVCFVHFFFLQLKLLVRRRIPV